PTSARIGFHDSVAAINALNIMMGNKGAIVVDIDPAKRDAAKKAGAMAVVDGNAPDAAKQIIKLTNGGAWAVIDYVGSSATVQLGVDAITKGGKVIVVGLFGGDITVPTPFFPLRAMTIQGSYVGSLPEMKELLALVRAKGLPPVPLKTRPLDDVAAVLDELRAGKVIGRIVLTPA
ncbi:MAG: zinc-binding dehydrogenase, partial [Pseudolabrys sp.]